MARTEASDNPPWPFNRVIESGHPTRRLQLHSRRNADHKYVDNPIPKDVGRYIDERRVVSLPCSTEVDLHRFLMSLFLLSSLSLSSSAQTVNWAESASTTYGVGANIPYGTFGTVQEHLDVWQNQENKSPKPTLLYIHGGGWVFGDKGGAPNAFLPFVEHGWNVVNVEYRMAGSAVAPGAVEDVRCALRWVYRHSDEYHFDTSKIVAMGHSAGGHLALLEGMIPNNSPLDTACPADEKEPPLRVAAVVNWFGITDVADLLSGPNRRTYAVAWLGSQPGRDATAKEVSPLTYIRAGLPPIITIHGDHDPVVPYTQGERLDSALENAHVPHELVTIPGGSHGGFTPEELHMAYTHIWAFLTENHITSGIGSGGNH